MNSQKSVGEGIQDNKSEIDPAIYQLFKRMMVEILSEQAEASCGKAPTKGKAPVTFSINERSNISTGNSRASRGSNQASRATKATRAATWESVKARLGNTVKAMIELPQYNPQQKGQEAGRTKA